MSTATATGGKEGRDYPRHVQAGVVLALVGNDDTWLMAYPEPAQPGERVPVLVDGNRGNATLPVNVLNRVVHRDGTVRAYRYPDDPDDDDAFFGSVFYALKMWNVVRRVIGSLPPAEVSPTFRAIDDQLKRAVPEDVYDDLAPVLRAGRRRALGHEASLGLLLPIPTAGWPVVVVVVSPATRPTRPFAIALAGWPVVVVVVPRERRAHEEGNEEYDEPP